MNSRLVLLAALLPIGASFIVIVLLTTGLVRVPLLEPGTLRGLAFLVGALAVAVLVGLVRYAVRILPAAYAIGKAKRAARRKP